MKNQLLNRICFVVLVTVLFANNCYPQRITREDAIKIAETVSKNILEDVGSKESYKITIKRIDTIKYEDKTIGYVFYLNPGGLCNTFWFSRNDPCIFNVRRRKIHNQF